ncbi:MAG: hypothetical protein R3D57_15500 [Hyphomicrobiaceae bacterium]
MIRFIFSGLKQSLVIALTSSPASSPMMCCTPAKPNRVNRLSTWSTITSMVATRMMIAARTGAVDVERGHAERANLRFPRPNGFYQVCQVGSREDVGRKAILHGFPHPMTLLQ